MLMVTIMMAAMVLMVAFAFTGPSASKASARRLVAIRGRHGESAEAVLEARMRRAISNNTSQRSDILASLIPNPENLQKRLRMTGKKWSVGRYIMASGGIAVAIALLLILRGFSPLFAIFLGLAVGVGLPHKWVSRLIAKRIAKFNSNFPDALELMVRGLRSGLPITETLGIVGSEVKGPVGEEFRLVSERIKIGKTMEQALQETADRLGTPEMQFFTITLAIQRETGGNLAETLSNLATVLRQRGQMRLKIRAMSSESKASAYIIGVLPFMVFGMISWINFDYMRPFYTSDPTGMFGLGLMQIVGIGGMCWMGIGAFIMAQMISFEI